MLHYLSDLPNKMPFVVILGLLILVSILIAYYTTRKDTFMLRENRYPQMQYTH